MNIFKSIFSAVLVSLALSAQAQLPVKVSGEIFNSTGDSVILSQNIGNRYVDYAKAAIDKKGKFSISAKIPNADYYVIRLGNQFINIILRKDSDVKVYGDAKNLAQFFNIVNSEESVKLNEYIVRMRIYNMKKDSATQYLRAHPEQERAINESFMYLYTDFQNYKNNFLKDNPNSPALIPMLNDIDSEKEFPMYETVVQNLLAGFPESPAVQNVKKQYEDLKAKKAAMSFLEPGKVAPDFSQNKADGTPLKLSDLKGNVVLLDFWASWCGPCRAENPNVVKLYNKYKDAGFTVMSVSLDNNKDKWLAAIAKDGLVWPNHVSDLKYWQNAVAQQYKVSGIPFTVLIDKEGKIINKNLRGAELENTLKGIFGF
ncbi:MAG: TlpA family protein disulfide reductase [Flavobacteriia bacterium]|jgi:thiol-disulfide isomerase/thioredoxin